MKHSPCSRLFNVNCYSSPFSDEGAIYNPIIDAIYMPDIEDMSERTFNFGLELAHRSMQNSIRCIMRLVATFIYGFIDKMARGQHMIKTDHRSVLADTNDYVKSINSLNKIMDVLYVVSLPVEEIWSLLCTLEVNENAVRVGQSKCFDRNHWESEALKHLRKAKEFEFDENLYKRIAKILRVRGIDVVNLMTRYALNPPFISSLPTPGEESKFREQYQQFPYSPVERLKLITHIVEKDAYIIGKEPLNKYVKHLCRVLPPQDNPWVTCCTSSRCNDCWLIANKRLLQTFAPQVTSDFIRLIRWLKEDWQNPLWIAEKTPYKGERIVHRSAESFHPLFMVMPNYLDVRQTGENEHKFVILFYECVRQQLANGESLECPLREVIEGCRKLNPSWSRCPNREMLDLLHAKTRRQNGKKWPKLDCC